MDPRTKNGFAGLSKDVCQVVGKYADVKTLRSLTFSCKAGHTFFQKSFGAAALRDYVGKGNEEQACNLLTDNADLMIMLGNVTDYSSREFTEVSAFILAIWMLDKNMWLSMYNAIPKNALGEAIRQELLKQFHALRENGIRYCQNGKVKTAKHYQVTGYARALTYLSLNIQLLDPIEQWTYWSNVMLPEEDNIPANLAQQMLRKDNPFYTNSFRDDKEFPRTLECDMAQTGERIQRLPPPEHAKRVEYNFDEGKAYVQPDLIPPEALLKIAGGLLRYEQARLEQMEEIGELLTRRLI